MSAPDFQPVDNPETESDALEVSRPAEAPPVGIALTPGKSAEAEKKTLKDRLLDNLDDLLSGPRAARLVSGGLIVLVAVVVCVSQLSDLAERRQINQHLRADYQNGQGTHDLTKDDSHGASQAMVATKQEDHASHHLAIGDGRPIFKTPNSGNGTPDDELIVNYYTSDGCVLVHRHQGKIETNDWNSDKTASPQPSHAQSSSMRSFDLDDLDPMRAHMTAYTRPRLLRVQGGRCWNPHPGAFSWWWGPPVGCWVPMQRQFQDGCLHRQMFNSCGNYWDTNIYWERCVH